MKHSGTAASDVVLPAGLLGIVAGMRSQLPLAMLAVAAGRGDFAKTTGRPWNLLRTRPALLGLGGSAIGEIVVDKLPVVPSRLAPAPLAGRTVFGGAAGAVVAKKAGGSVPFGAGIGALGALAGSYAGYHARTYLARTTGRPDAFWAGLEDALAIALGVFATRKTGRGDAATPRTSRRRRSGRGR